MGGEYTHIRITKPIRKRLKMLALLEDKTMLALLEEMIKNKEKEVKK